jgi:hypothetical protein
LALQQPVHDAESQMHASFEQCSPVGHVPLPHFPPHPSLAPHAAAVQFGMHPHTPIAEPPPHVRKDVRSFECHHSLARGNRIP